MAASHYYYLALACVCLASGSLAADTCLIGRAANCQGEVSAHLAVARSANSCVRFTDLPGDCKLTLSAQTKATGCFLPVSKDVAVTVAKNGQQEELVQMSSDPQLQWNLPVGYNELVLKNNHVQWPRSCQVEITNIAYCCVPRAPRASEDAPWLEGAPQANNKTQAALEVRLHIEEQTEKRLVSEALGYKEKFNAATARLKGTQHALLQEYAQLDFYQTLAAVLLWAFVLLIASYCLIPELRAVFERLVEEARTRYCQTPSRSSLIAPLLADEAASLSESAREVVEPVIPEEPAFAPPFSVFDYVNGKGQEVRCIRVEVPGRTLVGGRRSVSGVVKAEPLPETCGTSVTLELSRETELPINAIPVAPRSERKVSDGACSTSTASSSGNKMDTSSGSSGSCNAVGTWHKTLIFTDGFWHLLDEAESELNAAEDLDKHGLLQLQLVRAGASPAWTLNIAASANPGAQCERYDIADGSICDTSDAEWLESAIHDAVREASLPDTTEQEESPTAAVEPPTTTMMPPQEESDIGDGMSSFDKYSEVSVPVFAVEEELDVRSDK
eukprot:TRINITY_DN51449_c0_g1_i1.p1 TRINITY_DN51449_c0_g1~~TRINITY_DN51449_c0_g1_i1.p1  ORF type:complete len:591 (+),score=117.89 TRINITY_DN51449_c0_g1_i1:101-1774(+)